VAATRLRNRLREVRRDSGEVTQQALADAVGVSRQTVLAIEGNKYSPSLEVALRIARHFGTTVDALFWLED
jgi:putative transcriptional regulator